MTQFDSGTNVKEIVGMSDVVASSQSYFKDSQMLLVLSS